MCNAFPHGRAHDPTRKRLPRLWRNPFQPVGLTEISQGIADSIRFRRSLPGRKIFIGHDSGDVIPG